MSERGTANGSPRCRNCRSCARPARGTGGSARFVASPRSLRRATTLARVTGGSRPGDRRPGSGASGLSGDARGPHPRDWLPINQPHQQGPRTTTPPCLPKRGKTTPSSEAFCSHASNWEGKESAGSCLSVVERRRYAANRGDEGGADISNGVSAPTSIPRSASGPPAACPRTTRGRPPPCCSDPFSPALT